MSLPSHQGINYHTLEEKLQMVQILPTAKVGVDSVDLFHIPIKQCAFLLQLYFEFISL